MATSKKITKQGAAKDLALQTAAKRYVAARALTGKSSHQDRQERTAGQLALIRRPRRHPAAPPRSETSRHVRKYEGTACLRGLHLSFLYLRTLSACLTPPL